MIDTIWVMDDLEKLNMGAALEEADADWLKDNYAAGQSWVDLATTDGPDGAPALFGSFYKIELKSLFWYSPENFTDDGYDVPESMEDLKPLTKQMKADGIMPWRIDLGSGAAVIWKLVYDTRPGDQHQFGVLNAVLRAGCMAQADGAYTLSSSVPTAGTRLPMVHRVAQ